MKKSLSIGLAMLASILLIFVIAFVCLQQVITDEIFINNEFTKLETADAMGMNNADLVNSMMTLVRYMEGDAESIELIVTIDGQKVPMFDLEQERVHMEDVRDIYQTVRGYRDMAALALLLLFLLAALINFRQAPRVLSQGYLFGMFVMLMIFGFIGTWAAMDFSSFWTFFHEALFWNDLWLFDAAESRMINMLPERMFADIIARAGLYAGLIIAALIVLSALALAFGSERYKRANALAKQRRKQRLAYRKSRAEALERRRKALDDARRLAAKQAARRKAAGKAERARLAEEKALAEAQRARERAAEEKERRRLAAAEKREAAERQKAERPPAAAPREKRASAAPRAERPREAEAAAGRPRAARQERAKKPRASIMDDTGFLDE